MANTIATAVAAGIGRLRYLPEAAPRLEAELLLAFAAGLTRTQILTWPDRPLAEAELDAYSGLLARRASGEPMAYIRGRQSFWTLELQVSPATLIPRPETEQLVEVALERLSADAPLCIADLGTGSGAVAAALARERPRWQIIATDISAETLAVASANVTRLGLGNVHLLRADWLRPFGPAKVDALLSNPPYVRDGDPHLARGGLPYEPRAALAAGPDGLVAIRQIIANARIALRPGGLLAIEHGADQGPAARRLLAEAGYVGVDTRCDLAGLERVTYALSPKNQ